MASAKDAYYFPHDANARNDQKIVQLRSIYKAEGYGWYWMLLEMMREDRNHRIDIQGRCTWDALAMQMQCTGEQIKKFVDDCVKDFKLFASDGKHLWSDSFIRRMAHLDEVREKRMEAANIRWGRQKLLHLEGKPDATDADAMHVQSICNARKVKERKVKEREDMGPSASPPPSSRNKPFIPPTREEVSIYAAEIGYALDPDKFINAYEQKGWMVGKTKMKDWKAAIRNWKTNGWGMLSSDASDPRYGPLGKKHLVSEIQHRMTDPDRDRIVSELAGVPVDLVKKLAWKIQNGDRL